MPVKTPGKAPKQLPATASETRPPIPLAAPPRLQSGMAINFSRWLKTLGFAGLLAGLILTVRPAPMLAAVYLEDSPAALQLAEEASDLQAQGRLGEAAQKLQDIVDDYADKLMPTDETGYTDARRWVRQRLAGEPALLEAYRRRYATVAERALAEAVSADANRRETLTMAVIDRYPLTPASLNAALRLAGRYLERADVAGATAMLSKIESHPDRASANARYYELRAWSAALVNDDEARDAALAEWARFVEESRFTSLRETLDALAINRVVPSPQVKTVPLERPLWQVSIESPIEERVVRAQPRVAQNAAGETKELSPVASGSMLLINDNQRVYAIDRISGRLRWAHRYTADDTGANANLMNFGGGRVIQDRREVLARGDDAYAVLGFAVPWQGRHRRQVVQPTQLIRLDRDTGELRWSVTPGDLDPLLERAAFHGTPVACGDQIIVMARRSQASSFQDSYLFSVDAATGELRWRRHLASTAGPNSRNALPPMSSMTLDGDTVYLCDNLGAVAAVDARIGSIRWVRVLLDERVDDRGRPQGIAIPFSEASRPQRCAAGLVVPMRINTARGLLLDPDTGKILEEFKSQSPLANAYDFARLDDGDLLVIGPQLARLAGDTLEPRWTTAISPANVEGITPRVSLRPGVAMVARESTGLQFIDLKTGQLTAELALPWTGGVLATDDAWVITSGRRLAGYLDWSLAYDTLRQRAEAQPRSPEPGLNMAMLAINAGQPDAVDEGVDRALRALAADANRRERDPEAWRDERSRVFGELLDLTERNDIMEPAVIERLFDRLAVTTETPAELLAYNLARGDFLVARNRLAEAVDFYQAILLDPQQANESLVRGATTRRGDIAARLRLLRLAEGGSLGFYERFDRLAERELSTLLATPNADVDALLGLARRYPLARVSGEAIFAAAQRQAQSTNHIGAATQYRRAFQLADDDDLRRRAAGALANYYQSTGRADAAVRWLEQVARDHPGISPMRNGFPADSAAWLAELRQSPQNKAVGPSLIPPFAPVLRLQGQLIPPADPAVTLTRPGGVLYINAGDERSIFGSKESKLSFYDLKLRKHRWQSPLSPDGWRLVDQGADNVVLWMPLGQQLVALNAATGEPLWAPTLAGPLLEDLGEGGLAESRRANADGLLSVIEADFGPINQGAINAGFGGGAAQVQPPRVLAGEAVVAVVDAKGRAFGLDRTSGLVLWQSALPVDAVTHARVVDDVLAVAGTVSPGTEAQSGRFLLIDLATGRPRFPPVEDNDLAIDLQFTPGGDPLVFTRTQLLRYDRRDGGLRWRLPLADFNGVPQVVAAGNVLFIYDRVRLLSVDLDRGVIQQQAPNLLTRSTTPGVTVGRDQTLYSLTPEGSVAFDADLVVRWQDGLASLPKQLVTQCLGEQHVFVFERYQGLGSPPGLRLSALDRASGKIVAHTMLTNLGQAGELTTVELLRDHLLLAGRNDIALIPGTPASGIRTGAPPETGNPVP